MSKRARMPAGRRAQPDRIDVTDLLRDGFDFVSREGTKTRRRFRTMTERSGKTGQVTLGVWFDEEAGDIHLSIPGQGLSTVNSNAESKRGNPHLFNKLAKVLREQGKPHPAVAEEWDRGAGN